MDDGCISYSYCHEITITAATSCTRCIKLPYGTVRNALSRGVTRRASNACLPIIIIFPEQRTSISFNLTSIPSISLVAVICEMSQDEELAGEPPASINPYEILEVDEKATADEIKSAYRKKALKHHPGTDPFVLPFLC